MANNLREFRQKKGLSQTKLGCETGLAGSVMSDFELGKRIPWPKARQALARALDTTETELFPEQETRNGK